MKQPKIMVIDDDQDLVESIRLILEKNDYKVISTSDGAQGLEMIKQERPDLVILDVMMDKKDGFTVCRELKADQELCSIPVLMLTAVGSRMGQTSYSLEQGLNIQAEDYIDKPVQPDELLRRVADLIKTP